jgi:hypothetical protein
MADIVDLVYEDHDWFRRRFFYLDQARTVEELRAIWEPLARRLDTHADAEERILYPVLLKKGGADQPGDGGDPEDETEDAISDHNAIRDGVRDSHDHEVGSEGWWDAVNRARRENGEHLEEEEREALPDFLKSTTSDLRHDLAMQWLKFYAQHPLLQGVDTSDKDPEAYIDEHS